MLKDATAEIQNEIVIFKRWRDAAEEQGLGNAVRVLGVEVVTREMAIAGLQQTAKKN